MWPLIPAPAKNPHQWLRSASHGVLSFCQRASGNFPKRDKAMADVPLSTRSIRPRQILCHTHVMNSENTHPIPAPILIADDSDNDVFMLKARCQMARLTNPIVSVADGEATIAYLQGEGIYQNRAEYPYPVLLLLDLKMPRKNGFEVMEWIKAHPAHRQLPIIVLSAFGAAHQISRCYQLGARNFLLKPIDFQSLRKSLSKVRDLSLATHADHCCLESTGVHVAAPEPIRQGFMMMAQSER
jgi:CheY-like chemotaxis protein